MAEAPNNDSSENVMEGQNHGTPVKAASNIYHQQIIKAVFEVSCENTKLTTHSR